MNGNQKYFEQASAFANENFSNYDGWGNNFVDEYNYADGSQGASAQTALSSLPYIINILNTSTTDQTNVTILNANTAGNASAPAFGNNVAIQITMDNGGITYAEFLQDIKSRPFKIGMMYLQSSNTSQIFKQLTITSRESNGLLNQLPVTPNLDPYQQQNTVTIINYMFSVNAYTSITTTILASALLTIKMFPAEVVDLSRSLDDRTVSKAYAKPGLSQFQAPGRPLIG